MGWAGRREEEEEGRGEREGGMDFSKGVYLYKEVFTTKIDRGL